MENGNKYIHLRTIRNELYIFIFSMEFRSKAGCGSFSVICGTPQTFPSDTTNSRASQLFQQY